MNRPFVWVLGILVAFFLLFRLFFGEWQDKKYYPLAIDSGGKEAVSAVGTFERYEKKPKTCALFLKSVTVTLTKKHQKVYFQNLLVITKSDITLLCFPGNMLQLNGYIENLETASNPGSFDEKQYYKEKNIFYKLYSDDIVVVNYKVDKIKYHLFHIKERLRQVYKSSLSSSDAGVVSAMLLGDKELLDMKIKELYQTSGIGHLLAISGLHISILCMAVYQMLIRLGLNERICFGITLSFLYAYGTMTGFAISTNRAVIMMSLFLLSKQIRRSYDAATAMAVSAVLILLQKPYALFSSSFLLSYSALAGVVFVVPVLEGLLRGSITEQDKGFRKATRNQKERIKNTSFPTLWKVYFFMKHLLASSAICSTAVTLSTLPFLAYFYYEIPAYGIILNIIVIPLAGILVVFSAAGGAIGLIFLPASKIVLFPVHYILLLYSSSCSFFQNLPESIQILGRPSYLQLIIYMILSTFLIIICKRNIVYQDVFPVWKRLGSVFLFAVSFIILCYRPNISGIRFTMLDVGQGDGMVIQSETGLTILIDGGSTSISEVGKYRIIPFLKYQGIRKLDFMIMTHEDEDHISGQLELLEQAEKMGISIGTYLLPEPSNESTGTNYQSVQHVAEKSGIPVRFLHKGDSISSGEMKLFCLHPEKGFEAESPNAYSVTLRLTYGDYSMLLTGDLEKNGEDSVLQELLKEPELHLSVLKVAHHGSKNSTSEELLKKLNPKNAIISCGRNNRYGHPHAALLKRLKESGTIVFRTDQTGALMIDSDGKKWTLKTWCKKIIAD